MCYDSPNEKAKIHKKIFFIKFFKMVEFILKIVYNTDKEIKDENRYEQYFFHKRG